MVHAVPAVGLASRPYFHHYSDDAIDLCDVLSSYSSQAKVSLHELCKVMGLPGKPNGISRADVDRYYREGRIARFPIIAKAMCSTRTVFGCDMNCFVVGCPMKDSERVKTI
jgi:Predicted 3'-5' exonuclease related to the exonuclease domain of PolB